jgi:HAD superfamily hydrolase (TIGR01509 family)
MKLLSKKRHWIFDLDGTLTVATHNFNEIRTRLGIPEASDILDYISLQDSDYGEELAQGLDEIEKEHAQMSTPAPGARTLLNYLRRCQYKVGVITRNSLESAMISLAATGLDGFFTDVISRTEAHPKPHPEGILMLQSRWMAPAESMIMVGDYRHDLQAGRNAGITTVFVKGSRKEDWDELTDIKVKDLNELITLLPPP